MKQKQLIVPSLLWLAFLVFTSRGAYAQGNSTEVTIKLTEPELYIESVTAPQFETYQYATRAKSVHPISDLRIQVIDKREVKSPWQLKYGISLFETTTDETLGAYSLSKGILYTGDKEVEESRYQAHSLTTRTNDTNAQPIVSVLKSTDSSYQYVVDKQAISLDVPAKAKIGKYYSKEVVTLESTPDYE